MHAVDPIAQTQECRPPGEPASSVASVSDLAQDSSDYVRAWSSLVASETRLATASALRLALAALIIPALALAICITVDALVVAVLDRWLHDWASSIAITLLLNLAGLFALLVVMRRWWRNLSLPRSRGALTRLLQRIS
jgi:hypothetical protein